MRPCQPSRKGRDQVQPASVTIATMCRRACSILMLTLLGCSRTDSAAVRTKSGEREVPADERGDDDRESAAPELSPETPSPTIALEGVPTEGLNAFTFEFVEALGADQGNLVVSPLSVAIALGMLVPGARGNTQKELLDALDPKSDPETLTDAMGGLYTSLNALRGEMTFAVADRFFGSPGVEFSSDYLQTLETRFEAPLEVVNFAQPQEARARINDWVEENTEQKVRELLPPKSLDPSTVFVLVNAMHFHATWEQKFPTSSTKPQSFHAPGGDVEVPMMRLSGKLEYFEDERSQAKARGVVLPYDGGRFAMAVVVLEDASTVPNSETFSKWLEATTMRPVSLGLPRFHAETPRSIELEAPLKKLGIVTMWTSKADSSGIAPGLRVSRALHKSFIEVDEKGTEAAAATAVLASRGSSRASRVELVVDRPFWFFVYDTHSKLVAFLGRVDDPSS